MIIFDKMYAIVDIETTGGHAAAGGITEVAVYIHDGTRVVKHFETLVNPGRIIPRYITALTGIDNEMVAGAPDFETIAPALYELLDGQIFVAHNVHFDYSFIRHHLRSAGLDFSAKKLCTVRLSRKVFPGLPSYSLGNLCRSLHIPIEHRHRAGGDAKATVHLLEHLLANDQSGYVAQMLKRSSAEQWLPPHLDKQAIQQLPLTPGVYYFHNAKGTVIYVGKAVNIRKRVSSHFTTNDGGKKRQHLTQETHRVTCKACAGELEATIWENIEIRRLWPAYNQSLKKPVSLFGLYAYEDHLGYRRLAIDKKKKHLPALYTFSLLHEGITMLRKMVEAFELNEKLCFLDKTPFVKGELDEHPAFYNTKVKQALATLEEQLPTFAVVDKGLQCAGRLCLLIERGCFWGMGYLPETIVPESAAILKAHLQPYPDNDSIRHAIYTYVEQHPHTKVVLVP